MIPFSLLIGFILGLYLGSKGWAHYVEDREETDNDLN